MNLLDKEKDYGHSGIEMKVFESDDVKEAMIELSKWKLSYAYQSGECIYCPKCKKSTAIWFRKLTSPKFFPKVERRCKDCLVKEIFGNFEE